MTWRNRAAGYLCDSIGRIHIPMMGAGAHVDPTDLLPGLQLHGAKGIHLGHLAHILIHLPCGVEIDCIHRNPTKNKWMAYTDRNGFHGLDPVKDADGSFSALQAGPSVRYRTDELDFFHGGYPAEVP